jgi:hypothetical protein
MATPVSVQNVGRWSLSKIAPTRERVRWIAILWPLFSQRRYGLCVSNLLEQGDSDTTRRDGWWSGDYQAGMIVAIVRLLLLLFR